MDEKRKNEQRPPGLIVSRWSFKEIRGWKNGSHFQQTTISPTGCSHSQTRFTFHDILEPAGPTLHIPREAAATRMVEFLISIELRIAHVDSVDWGTVTESR